MAQGDLAHEAPVGAGRIQEDVAPVEGVVENMEGLVHDPIKISTAIGLENGPETDVAPVEGVVENMEGIVHGPIEISNAMGPENGPQTDACESKQSLTSENQMGSQTLVAKEGIESNGDHRVNGNGGSSEATSGPSELKYLNQDKNETVVADGLNGGSIESADNTNTNGVAGEEPSRNHSITEHTENLPHKIMDGSDIRSEENGPEQPKLETSLSKEPSQNGNRGSANRSSNPPQQVINSGPSLAPIQSANPLKVIIVGAGIGGLTAAASLRQAGHEVKLFEQSRFSNELGAAIHVGPNASRLLGKLGYDPVRLRGVHCKGFAMHKSDGTLIREFSNELITKSCTTPWYLAHRVDLHNELKHLALDPELPGKPAELILDSTVVEVDEYEGTITLQNGDTHQADLIVAADGIHSRIREAIFDPSKPKPTGTAAYRFVLDSSAVIEDPECLPIKADDGSCRVMIGPSKRVVLYPCRDSTLLNFVCMHESGPVGETAAGWNSTATAEDVVETFKEFSPLVLNMLRKAKNVKRWHLLERDAIPSWIKGRVCLIGDAAHPMLPHQGQGGGQAMEDGAALGPLFTLGTNRENVMEVLELFQQVRHPRASKVQWLSATQYAGKESIDPLIVQKFIFQHDVVEFAKHLRSSQLIL